jgi:cytochrome c oxidase subunit 2
MDKFLGRWMPIDASAHGAALDYMTVLLHWLMAVLFVGWALYFIYVLFRFRSGRNPQASYTGTKSHFSTWTEIGVVVVEAVILIGFAIPAWAKWVTPHAESENPLQVRVVGEQFAWNIQYPGADGVFGANKPELIDASTNPLGLDPEDPFSRDDILSLNQLHLPVDRPVTVRLTTKDVIHSFFLPVMRVKQDAIPGMEIPVHFTPKMVTPEESRFPACAADKSCWEIGCAQLCGLGHYRMRGYLTVHSAEGFEDWMAEMVAEQLPSAPEMSTIEPTGEVAIEMAAVADHPESEAAGRDEHGH